MQEKIKWIISQHEKTNHRYDDELPYCIHLSMVAHVAERFAYLLPLTEEKMKSVILAAWGHDLIEDCRVTYNDVKEVLGEYATEIIYAVTNEKGRNRGERGSIHHYQEMRKNPAAVFVKLCDRIANAKYSIYYYNPEKSRMGDLYRRENDAFLKKIGYVEGEPFVYADMVAYLKTILK